MQRLRGYNNPACQKQLAMKKELSWALFFVFSCVCQKKVLPLRRQRCGPFPCSGFPASGNT